MPAFPSLPSLRTLFTATIMLLVTHALAGEPVLDTNRISQALRIAKPAQLPSDAASILRRAGAANRLETATNIIWTVERLNSAALVPVSAALSREQPALAPAIAGEAAVAEPLLVEDIARAGAGVAPRHAGEIVERVGNVAPAEVFEVAIAAGEAAPAQARDVLRAVGSVRPELRPFVESELARYGSRTPSVSKCLERVQQVWQRSRPRLDGNHDAASPLNRPGTKPPKGGGGPPGGRNYAKP